MSTDTLITPPPDGCERVATWEDVQATAERIVVRLAAAESVAQACAAWAIDTGECHFCNYDGPGKIPHDEECPLPAYLATIGVT